MGSTAYVDKPGVRVRNRRKTSEHWSTSKPKQKHMSAPQCQASLRSVWKASPLAGTKSPASRQVHLTCRIMPLCPLEPSGTLQIDAQNSIRLLRPLLTVPRSKFVPNLQAKKQICHVIKLGLQMASILWRSQGCWNCDRLDQNCMQLRHIFPYVSILPRGSSASEGGPSWIWTWAIAICSILQLELARII